MLIKLLRNIFIYINNFVNKYHIESMFLRKGLLLFIINFFLFCNSIKDDPVARVGETYLYRSEIDSKFNFFENNEDSIVKVRSYVDSWARKNLLYQQAFINLSDKEIDDLENLINNYRSDLYGTIYKESLLSKLVDTLSIENNVDSLFLKNREIFRLNESLYKIRFIQFSLNNINRYDIKKRFIRFNYVDKIFLDSLSYQFTNKILYDSIWISKKKLIDEISFLNNNNLKTYIKKLNYFEVKDSLELFLLYVVDFKKRGEIAPLSHVVSEVKNIILNQKKIELSKKIDKEIIQDAIKSKKFEIYY